MKVEILEVAGLVPAMQALRLPYGKEPRSEKKLIEDTEDGKVFEFENIPCYGRLQGYVEYIHKEDIALAQKLIKAGDAHAKAMRGIIAYFRINAPIYFWWDLETYIAGHQRLCSESTMNAECKGLTGEALQKAKGEIKFGREIKKIDFFSYQCLRNIWKQRRNHRLPEFKTFIDACRQLPFANELIFVE